MSPSRLLAPGLALALALGLTGCGAGFRAQTYQERTQAQASNESVGALALRNLRVLAPEGEGSAVYEQGEDAEARMSIVNKDADEDVLVSVTSPLAASVDIVGVDGPQDELDIAPLASTSAFALVLRGLTREVRTGEYIEMELVFERSGSESVLVPVQLTGDPGEREADLDSYHLPPVDSTGKVVGEHDDEEH